VHAGDENRLAGYTALPLDQNPYRDAFDSHRLVAGVIVPAPGSYDIVFDTPRGGRAGGFRFRYWRNDTAPPAVRLIGVHTGFVEFAVADGGSGVDAGSIEAQVDGRRVAVSLSSGRARVSLARISRGRHALTFTVADYQETKNNENVARILPNTRTVRRTIVVRR
jgi:hypothetical protein